MEETNLLKNVKIFDDAALMEIDPKIYPLSVVHSAAYILIDKAFIVLGGDPKEKLLVEIRRKDASQDLRALVIAFNEELLNYAAYSIQFEKNKELREAILRRVLLTNI